MRFDADTSYHYYVYHDEIRITERSYFWQYGQCWIWWGQNRAAAELLGEHDFRSFGSPPEGGRTVRTVMKSCWEEISATERVLKSRRTLFYTVWCEEWFFFRFRLQQDG